MQDFKKMEVLQMYYEVEGQGQQAQRKLWTNFCL
jgi:hypothetical protein